MPALPILIALAVAATPPAADPPASARAEEEVRIPLAAFRLRTFQPAGDDIVYLQDWERNWYKATLDAPCYPLRTALRLGLDTYGSSTIDNTSSLLVEDEDCRIVSLVRSEGPPGRRR